MCGATKAKKVRAIIEEAKREEFHDYKSPHDMPKVELVQRLRDASLNIMARRVMDGEFDEHADAADQASMSLELRNSPNLRHLLKLPEPGKA
jgi:hypothetical protein